MDDNTNPTAIVTGASRGFGHAIARLLAAHGWTLVLDGRDADRLAASTATLGPRIAALAGDVTDTAHVDALVAAAARTGRLDLLVNNASELGPSPLLSLADVPIDAFERTIAVNVVAPLRLVQAALPLLARSRGAIVDVTSDAAVEAYPGWGGYSASKAALDQLGAVLAVDLDADGTDVAVWSLDPGDMRTDMHQAAFPGEDISDRADPAAVAPAVLRLVQERPPSGRVRAADLLPASGGSGAAGTDRTDPAAVA